MSKSIYVQFLSEQPNSNPHYLSRLIKLLNHFIFIEPKDKPKGFECHHIVPKSWKPEWNKIPNNRLKVPTKAHYIIHHLMWKAFPKNHAMIKAFQQMCRLNEKITAKVYEVLKLNYCHSVSEWNLERVKNKTHNFLGGEIQKKRVTDKTHHLLNGEIQKRFQKEKVSNGTHHWLGNETQKKRVSNGTHPCVSKKTCPHCGKIVTTASYGRWHGEKCKLKTA